MAGNLGMDITDPETKDKLDKINQIMEEGKEECGVEDSCLVEDEFGNKMCSLKGEKNCKGGFALKE